MYTITQKLDHFTLDYPVERLAPPEEVLFLDIETTGFTAKSSSLYMIGAAFFEENCWSICQWFANSPEDQKELLSSFFAFASNYKYLIHFNGNNFDLPYLTQKCEVLDIPCPLSDFQGIDIYRRVSPYKFFLKLPNCKQKTIENYLNINRIDTFSGGELIGIYRDYVKNPSDFSKTILLQHNFDDIRGMLQILPILSYYDMFQEGVRAKKVQANYYTDFTGHNRQELIMNLSIPVPLPKSVSAASNDCYFKADSDAGSLKVPIYDEEMKYFYANYKEYYYLPTEDIALHKTVASFVDKEHRTPATAATCYTRKYSSYLPQWELLVQPFFKRDYKSKSFFFELTDEIKKDRSLFTKYANHILQMITISY